CAFSTSFTRSGRNSRLEHRLLPQELPHHHELALSATTLSSLGAVVLTKTSRPRHPNLSVAPDPSLHGRMIRPIRDLREKARHLGNGSPRAMMPLSPGVHRSPVMSSFTARSPSPRERGFSGALILIVLMGIALMLLLYFGNFGGNKSYMQQIVQTKK